MTGSFNIGTKDQPIIVPAPYPGGVIEAIIVFPLIHWFLWLAAPGVSRAIPMPMMMLLTVTVVTTCIYAHRRSVTDPEWGQIFALVLLTPVIVLMWLGVWLAPYGLFWGLLSVSLAIWTVGAWWRARRQHLLHSAGLAPSPVGGWSSQKLTQAMVLAGGIGATLARGITSETVSGAVAGMLWALAVGGFAAGPFARVYTFYVVRKARLEGPFTPDTLP